MLEKHHQAQLPLHTHRAGAASKLGPLGAVTAMLHLFAVWLFPRVSIFHSLPAHKRIICDFLRLLHCDILSDQFRSITSIFLHFGALLESPLGVRCLFDDHSVPNDPSHTCRDNTGHARLQRRKGRPQFKNITSDWAFWKFDAVPDASGDNADFIWSYEQSTKLGPNVQHSMLGHDQKVAVCAVESFMSIHVFSSGEYIDSDARLHAWVASSSDQMEAVDPVYRLVKIKGIPSELIGNLMDLLSWLVLRVRVECSVFSWFKV
ncbi:homogentisate 1,2-dioxygenase, partial [Aureobasidium melanogenum]